MQHIGMSKIKKNDTTQSYMLLSYIWNCTVSVRQQECIQGQQKYSLPWIFNKFMTKSVKMQENVYSLPHQIKDPWNRDS